MGYRLILSDCLSGMHELNDENVHLVVTSPPYAGVSEMWGDFWSADNFHESHAWLDRVWDECLRVLVPGGYLAINTADIGRNPYLANSARIQMWGWNRTDKVTPRGQIIWDKGVARRGETAWGTWRNPRNWSMEDNYEYIVLFRKNGERAGTNEYTTTAEEFLEWRISTWRIGAAKATTIGHIAPFPIEIPNRLIKLCTFEGETVLDPFAGSGTTLIAAEILGRNGIGYEIDAARYAHAQQNINEQLARAGKADRVIESDRKKYMQQRIAMEIA